MADLLALVGDVYCICVTFPYGILGMIELFPDLCRLSYFERVGPLKLHVVYRRVTFKKNLYEYFC